MIVPSRAGSITTPEAGRCAFSDGVDGIESAQVVLQAQTPLGKRLGGSHVAYPLGFSCLAAFVDD